MTTIPPRPHPSARLHVRAVALEVHLGHGAEERARPQRVEVDVILRFHRPPAAVETDLLADTVDYGALVEALEEAVDGREYRMVEHLAGVLYRVVRARVRPEDALELRVRKVAPPVPAITGGAEFVLSDG